MVLREGLKKGLVNFCYFVPCHRKPDRCFHYKGKHLPICSRCLSILLGFLALPLLFFFEIPFYIGVLLQLPMLLDGFTQLWKWRTSNNYLRALTGLLSGTGLSIAIIGAARFVVSL